MGHHDARTRRLEVLGRGNVEERSLSRSVPCEPAFISASKTTTVSDCHLPACGIPPWASALRRP
jgi:hypothetical protein